MTGTVTIDIPYVMGPSIDIFPLLAGIVVVMIVKWLVDILP